MFDNQPVQYGLPKTQTETWSHDEVNALRKQVMLCEFDKEGNPVREETSDGTVTEYT